MTELFDRLSSMAISRRDKIIFSDGEGEYGIIETWDFSGRVYRYLSEHNIGREDVVMIHLPRCARSIMAAIGVLRAGAAVTIHEDISPKEWVDFVRKDTSCKLILNSELIGDILKTEPMDGWKERDLHDLAYITYTTGTTGERKAVMHEYGTIERMIETINITAAGWTPPEQYRSGIVVSLHSAMVSIIYSIAFCSYLDIVPYEIIQNKEAFRKRLIENRIYYTYASPVMLNESGWLDSPYLECIGTSFEPATNICSHSVPIINEYGMTESGSVISEFIIDRMYEIVPIGKPIRPDETFILDKDGNQVRDGVIGEICFKNNYCRGYLNMPEATAAQFKGDIFHTRDLGKVLPDGNWLMLGRMNDSVETPDGMIVALEIEALARKELNYNGVYVKVFPSEGRPVICVYSDRQIDLNRLRESLSVHLPEYKLPTDFVLVDGFIYKNGKAIRLNLRNPYE